MRIITLCLLLVGCKKKQKVDPMADVDDIEVEDEGVFGGCEEKAEQKAGNQYRVFDCGDLQASYYDSPGSMTYEDVIAPMSAEARSLGYQVVPAESAMTIAGTSLPIQFLDHKTPEAVGGDVKFSVLVTLQPLEDDRTRVHNCKMSAPDSADQYKESVAWCNDAFNEMFSFEKSAAEALMEMRLGPLEDEGDPEESLLDTP